MHFFKVLASCAALTGIASAVSEARIREVFGLLRDGHWDQFYDIGASPDLTWTLQGGWEYAGTYNLSAVHGLIDLVNEYTVGCVLKLQINNIINDEETNTSVQEVQAIPGLEYNQFYSIVTEWDGDRILRAREYLDTDLGLRFFNAPANNATTCSNYSGY